MSSFKQKGVYVDAVAPTGGTVYDTGILIGDKKSGNVAQSSLGCGIFGVALQTVDAGQPFVMARKGVYSLAKVSAEVWNQWDLIYWDDEQKLLTNVPKGNFVKVGNATKSAAAASAKGEVVLCPEESNNRTLISHTAASADAFAGYVAGQGLLVGNTTSKKVIVVLDDIESGDTGKEVPAIYSGVTQMAKAAEAIAAYDLLFWDPVAKVVTKTSASGLFTIGYALEAKASDDDFISIHVDESYNTAAS